MIDQKRSWWMRSRLTCPSPVRLITNQITSVSRIWVRMPRGSRTVTIEVQAIDDTVNETQEDIVLVLPRRL